MSGTTDYLVRDAPRLVEAWSVTRLAFEPKGWQVAFRRDLRAAARRLEVAPSELLHATYGSADRSRCDAENVLFSNVGTGAFATKMQGGVRFERSFSLPADDAAVGAAHYHRYEPAAPEADLRWWRRGESLRRWTDVRWPTTTTNPTTGWWGAFSRAEAGAGVDASPPTNFGVEVVVAVPQSGRLSLHAVVKPLLDGLIGACSRHEGQLLGVVAERVAVDLGLDAGEVADRLTGGAEAVLGPRNLLWPWRESVQWNPADDRCVAATLRVRRGTDAAHPAIDAEVFVAVTGSNPLGCSTVRSSASPNSATEW